MNRSLTILISSTADLNPYRDAVEEALTELEIDGSRFEAWPSAPDPPLTECLRRVEESDAVVLLLGSRYGRICDQDISATHLEYRHAHKHNKPIFAYILKVHQREPRQSEFIGEVEEQHFRGPHVETTDDLKLQVKRSFLGEFVRCFRKVHATPPCRLPASQPEPTAALLVLLSSRNDPVEVERVLEELYNRKDHLAIHSVATKCELRFGNVPGIMNFVHMAEVNLAMDGSDIESQRLHRAIAFWRSPAARSRWPQVSLWYNEGNALSALGRHSESVTCYRKVLAELPDFAPTWKNLGQAYLDLKQLHLARSCLEQALQCDPHLFEAHYTLGVMAITHDADPRRALGCLDQADRSTMTPPQRSAVQRWKAIAYEQLGDYANAIKCAEDAISSLPTDGRAWSQAGRLYAMARRAEERWIDSAREFFERFVSRDPKQGEAWAELGYVYWKLREHADRNDLSRRAMLAFSKALECDTEHDGLIWDRLGHLRMEIKDYRRAEEAFRKAVEHSPDEFGYCLGTVLMSLQRYDEARKWLMSAATKHQPDALSWFQLARCHEGLGNQNGAIEAYRHATELDPEYALAWFNLGGLYWNSGDRTNAVSVWRHALARFPDHELTPRVRELVRKATPDERQG